MNCLKAFKLILFIAISGTLSAQSVDTLSYTNFDYFKKSLTISSYNSNSRMNDQFRIVNGEFLYEKSGLILQNNFKRNKIDCSNPYGTSDIKSALVLGFVDGLLQEFQK